MTLFLTTAAVMCSLPLLHRPIRQHYRPYVERRVQEHALGLPRGALRERWGHGPEWAADDAWVDQLTRLNTATRYLRGRYYHDVNRVGLP